MDPSEARAHRRLRQRFLVALVLACIENGAPAPLQVVARHLEEVGPFIRVGHVVAQAATERGGENERRGADQEQPGPEKAPTLDDKTLAHTSSHTIAPE